MKQNVCKLLSSPMAKLKNVPQLYIQNLSPSSQHLGCFLILHCSNVHITTESKT